MAGVLKLIMPLNNITRGLFGFTTEAFFNATPDFGPSFAALCGSKDIFNH